MKQLINFISEAAQHQVDRWVEPIQLNASKTFCKKYPKFPCEIWIADGDAPLGGPSVLKKGFLQLGFSKVSRKKVASRYLEFKEPVIAVTVENEEQWRLIVAAIGLENGGTYTLNDVGSFSKDSEVDKLMKDALNNNY